MKSKNTKKCKKKMRRDSTDNFSSSKPLVSLLWKMERKAQINAIKLKEEKIRKTRFKGKLKTPLKMKLKMNKIYARIEKLKI